MDFNTGLILLAGYAFSLIVGAWATKNVVETIPTHHAPPHYSSELLGLLERAIYTTTWLMGRELFIPVWLGLKVSAHWRTPVEQVRPIFNRWLVGTGVSLAFGVVAGEAIKHAKPGGWWTAVGLPVVLVVGTLLLTWRGQQRRGRITPPSSPVPGGL